MHWLIPAVSHALSSLFAWRGSTLTATAVLVSFLLAGAHSFHLWAAFYGLFALYFAAGTCLALISTFRSGNKSARNGETSPWIRTAAQLLSNAMVATALVQLHQFYLVRRTATVPWFHLARSKTGCLPIPSQTLHDPIQYEAVDAVGNNLPYGVVVSYAAAMAWLFSSSVGNKAPTGTLKVSEVVAGAFGALAVAVMAAYGMPMCGPDNGNGQHEVTMHVDRTVEWKERSPLEWSSEARYGAFVIFVTLAGTTGAVVAGQMTLAFGQRKAAQVKSAAKPQASKEKAVPEKVAAAKGVALKAPTTIEATGNGGTAGLITYYMASLCMNILITTSVVLGMALFSWTGPRASQMDVSKMGGMMPAAT